MHSADLRSPGNTCEMPILSPESTVLITPGLKRLYGISSLAETKLVDLSVMCFNVCLARSGCKIKITRSTLSVKWQTIGIYVGWLQMPSSRRKCHWIMTLDCYCLKLYFPSSQIVNVTAMM
jgi:hypothetical protein